ncbi:Chondroitin synthase [Mariniflexile rhizosphaerae]|uniref:glycosyltransferase n=1 Tax=unclassified Mariniflexile TaxID=2643887 RepID=UPI000E3376D2|nr:glycosyltransferase [Mariniflexile sp. TRM1-10]AXP79274.1 Chondroitin synthase [Mariniflexile sp. TRM1-10]
MSKEMQNRPDLISIVIPCYNDTQFIEQAVDSALNQTYFDKEIIVVDDGSDFETKKVLKNIEHKITKLITQENKGQSTARNVGIRYAKGEFVLVLDSDDFFEPTFCEKAINIFTSCKETKIVSCYANLLFNNGKKLHYKPKGGTIHDFLFFNQILGTSMFKRQDWEYCGGYDESMRNGFEDWEFFIRLLKNGGIAEVIKEHLYNYRKRLNSTTLKANENKYELLKYMFLKHKELYINNFELTISHLLNGIEREEIEKRKNTERLEFKIGQTILKPIRWVKSLLG